MRKATNRENDSPSRQLARYIKTVTNQYVDQLDIALVYRNDRFLRGGDHTLFSKMDSRPFVFVKEMKTTSNSIRTCEQKIT
jgi:ribosomal protein L27